MSQRDTNPSSPWRAVLNLGPAAIGGLLLLTAAAVAFGLANSPWANAYQSVWDTKFGVGVGRWVIEKPILLWINDGLMAVFFLLVGLEIKRELVDGALSSPSRAALPVFAAIGGIMVPAGIYAAINVGGGDMSGWAIPAATDIAFALGILALLGRRVPIELKIFLTAVAVVDDLGAILIIAVFFTDAVALAPLAVAAMATLALVGINRRGVRSPAAYIGLGVVLWAATLASGVHATVAGVLLAATIPARSLFPAEGFLRRVRESLRLGDAEDNDELPPDTAVHRVRGLCDDAESPLLRWEHALQPWVLFGIMPLFALANAGVAVDGAVANGLGTVGWGVALGLLLGKPLGVTAGAWVGVRLGLCEVSPQLTWARIHAAGWLAGIGFTMSIFITNLSLDGEAASSAKLGLLIASVAAGAVGTALLVRASRTKSATSQRTRAELARPSRA